MSLTCRAKYNQIDEEWIDIYRIWEGRKPEPQEIYILTMHKDDLDDSEVTDILDVGGTPEFEFGATEVVEVGIDES